ncbi:MAG: glyoxalase [Proteobacteria bacterium SG_bin5]|nr:VOC family protein [Sphingomonas sp.]OQW41192.1 MAG: glyoxalase [Proteobacteria bacterium SG_bin5]
MIGYATLGSNDLAKARAFYDALFGEIGAKRLMEFPDDQGGFTMWGTGWGAPAIAVTTPNNREAAVPGNGNMLAIPVESRAKVDALHAKACALGGSCDGPPGVRGEEGDRAFYGAYFRDPEGNKLCVYRVGPA